VNDSDFEQTLSTATSDDSYIKAEYYDYVFIGKCYDFPQIIKTLTIIFILFARTD